MPSRSFDMGIWQVKRELSRTCSAPSSMLSSSADGVGTLASQAGSIYPWQVAQLQQPPQSPTMPGTELSTAARMTEVPTLASTMCSVPSCPMKTTLNTDAPWNVQLSYSELCINECATR